MRAIILAAGMGTRLRPITLTTPKSLIEIEGETLIERQIRFLKECSIDDIVVVTGYLAEKFEFLKDKYGVTLVYNDKYDVYNNFYTMYLVKNYLSDCYVIDADNYLVHNFLKSGMNQSTYFSAYKSDFKDEWLIKSDKNNRVTDIEISSGEGYILSGVSYWDTITGEILQNLLDKYYQTDFTNIYWDNLVMENLDQLSVYINKISTEDIFEIDSVDDLKNLQIFLNSLK